jgi:hypothetical protein
MHKPGHWAAITGVGVALAACGTVGVAAAAPVPAHAVRAVRYYAFDINNGTTEPGFIPVPGTNPAKLSQGDELIINDQVTTTRKRKGGYPIVGFDSGVCTVTRIPLKFAEQTLANCLVTVVFKNGSSLTVQGAVRFKSQQPGQPERAVLAVTGGTGRSDGAAGEVRVSFTKNYKILTFLLK